MVPMSAVAKRQPNSLSPKMAIPAPISHFPTGG